MKIFEKIHIIERDEVFGKGKIFEKGQPEMYDCESKSDGKWDQAAADVHVVLVGDGEDDDQQQEGAKDLVCSQRVEGNLMLDILNIHSDSPKVESTCSVE